MHANLERLVTDIRAAGKAGAWHAALALALALPDICAKAAGAGHYDGGKGYRNWIDEYVELKVGGERSGILSGHVLYGLRNAFLHSGFDDLSTYRHVDRSMIKRVRLVESTDEVRGFLHYTADPPGGIGGTLEIPVAVLCELIVAGVEKWAKATERDSVVQSNLDRVLTIRTPSPTRARRRRR